MITDLHALAAAVVQSPHWRFGPPRSRKQEPRRTSSGVRWIRAETHGDWLPDLSDPPTIGCLLALVREAWGNPTIYTRHTGDDDEWSIHVRGGYRLVMWAPNQKSEVAVLVAALLAAPAPTIQAKPTS